MVELFFCGFISSHVVTLINEIFPFDNKPSTHSPTVCFYDLSIKCFYAKSAILRYQTQKIYLLYDIK